MSDLGPATLFGKVIHRWSSVDPHRLAFETDHDKLTYGQLEELVRRAMKLLSAAGVRHGDRVLVHLAPSAEYVVSCLAIAELGAVVVPLPTSIGADRFAYVTSITEARVCVHADGLEPPAGVARLPIAIDFASARIHSASAALDAQIPATASGDDDAVILFSSGSTGRPKGVILKHRHLLANVENLSTVFRLDRAHRDLIIAPMAHSDGLQRVLSTLFAGGTVVAPTRPLATNAILEFLPKHAVTGFFMPPPLLRLLWRSAPEAFREGTKTLRSIEFGSAPITTAELERLLVEIPSAGIFLHYGLTECSRAIILDARAHSDKLGTVGRPAPGVEIRICDPNGTDLRTGQEGEIWLRGRQLTQGYWKLE
ncbi:MAG: class I adenylate-forming enzyme family protein, partial [Polyangiaceae bacterium]